MQHSIAYLFLFSIGKVGIEGGGVGVGGGWVVGTCGYLRETNNVSIIIKLCQLDIAITIPYLSKLLKRSAIWIHINQIKS